MYNKSFNPYHTLVMIVSYLFKTTCNVYGALWVISGLVSGTEVKSCFYLCIYNTGHRLKYCSLYNYTVLFYQSVFLLNFLCLTKMRS